MRFQFNELIVDIDVDATKAYYRDVKPINGCNCDDCRNYRAYMKNCDSAMLEFFSSIGIDDLNYIREILCYDDVSSTKSRTGQTLSYGGFFHVKGTLEMTEENSIEKSWIDINDHFRVGIRSECQMVPKNFPQPVLQVELLAEIPYVLE
ncbi:MAG: hypothetical protein IJO50_02120 [Clostridia bacterium]|nr:hypothetical protein [Clostridia bacterium]